MKRIYPHAGIESCTDVCRVAVEKMGIDTISTANTVVWARKDFRRLIQSIRK